MAIGSRYCSFRSTPNVTRRRRSRPTWDPSTPRIVALSGSAAEIAGAAGAFDAFYEKVTNASGVAFDHTTKTYLVNRDGRLAASVDLRTPDGERRRVLEALLAEP